MEKDRVFIIDVVKFHSLTGFYKYISQLLMSGAGFEIRSLDGLNDILGGGFGQFEEDEPITIIWKGIAKSRDDLGYEQTLLFLQNKLKNCHISHTSAIKGEIQAARNNTGKTILDSIIDALASPEHRHITLILD